jgi:hypothetical protein
LPFANGTSNRENSRVWGFTSENDSQQLQYTQLQGENCPSCGEYTFISYTTKRIKLLISLINKKIDLGMTLLYISISTNHVRIQINHQSQII